MGRKYNFYVDTNLPILPMFKNPDNCFGLPRTSNSRCMWRLGVIFLVTKTRNDLHWATMTYNDLHWATMTYNDLQWPTLSHNDLQWSTMTYNELQWPKMSYCNDLQWPKMIYIDLQWPKMSYYNVLQWPTIIYNDLQWPTTTYNDLQWPTMVYNDLQWPTTAYLNDLQSKGKTEEDQGEEFGEQKTSIARCHATLLVHCMIAHMMTAITHVNLKSEINCEKTLGWFFFVLKLNWKCIQIPRLCLATIKS